MQLRDATPPAVQPVEVAQDTGKGLLLIVAIALFVMWASGKH